MKCLRPSRKYDQASRRMAAPSCWYEVEVYTTPTGGFSASKSALNASSLACRDMGSSGSAPGEIVAGTETDLSRVDAAAVL